MRAGFTTLAALAMLVSGCSDDVTGNATDAATNDAGDASTISDSAPSDGAIPTDAPPAVGFVPATGFTVTGTIAPGQSITIHGTGFGTKPNGAKPLYWFPFETSTAYDPAFSRGTATIKFNGTIATDVVPGGSSGVVRYDIAGNSSAVNDDPIRFDGTALYVWSRVRYDFAFAGTPATEFNLKKFRIWIPDFKPPMSDVYWGYQGASAGDESAISGNPRHVVEGVGEAYYGEDATHYLWPHRGTEWLTDELEFHMSSALGAKDGWYRPIRNASYSGSPTHMFTLRTAAFPGPLTDFYLDQKSNGIGSSIPNPGYVRYDALYVDDSLARVIVSPEPTYQKARYSDPTHKDYAREVQLVTAWADDAVTVTLRYGALASFAGTRLYVVRADGAPILIGSFP